MKLPVVIPARNEAASIAAKVAEIVSGLEHQVADHVSVVDDSSSDGTAEALLQLTARSRGTT